MGRGDDAPRRAVEGGHRATTGRVSHGFYNSGQLFLEEYYTLAVIAEAGIGTAHRRRQHAPVHRDGRDRADRVVRDRRRAGLVRGLRPDRRDLPRRPQHGLDPDGALGARPRPPRPAQRRRGWSSSTRVRRRPRAARTSTWRRARARTCRCSTGSCASSSSAAGSTPTSSETTRSTSRRWSPRPIRGRRSAWRPSPASPAERLEAAAEILGTTPTLVSTCLQGVYQSLQATATRRPGQQPAPDPRPDRQARLDGVPDERPADRAEHPRVRRRTASSSRSATGTTRRTSPRRREVWNVEPSKLPDLDPADPRDADLPSRGDRFDPAPVDHRHQPRGVACPSSAASGGSSAKEDLFVVVSDAFLTETAALADVVLPAAHLGREDRLHDQCRPDRPPLGARRSSRRARRAPTSTSCSTTPGAWTSATRTARRS